MYGKLVVQAVGVVYKTFDGIGQALVMQAVFFDNILTVAVNQIACDKGRRSEHGYQDGQNDKTVEFSGHLVVDILKYAFMLIWHWEFGT
jgi:hypothetical protein